MEHDVSDLLRATRSGDQQALHRLLAGQSIRQQFQGRFDESDVVQQTCCDAFRAIEDFRGCAAPEFDAWLNRILQRNLANLVHGHLARKRDVRREVPIATTDSTSSLMWREPADDGSSPSAIAIRGEAVHVLANALAQLSNPQRTAVQMRYLEGFRLSEIAEYLEVSTSSAAASIHRGLETLRKYLPTNFLE